MTISINGLNSSIKAKINKKKIFLLLQLYFYPKKKKPKTKWHRKVNNIGFISDKCEQKEFVTQGKPRLLLGKIHIKDIEVIHKYV